MSKAQVQIRSIQCNYYSFKFHLIYRFPSLSFILAIAIKILLKRVCLTHRVSHDLKFDDCIPWCCFTCSPVSEVSCKLVVIARDLIRFRFFLFFKYVFKSTFHIFYTKILVWASLENSAELTYPVGNSWSGAG